MMFEIPDTNQWITEFIGKNWVMLYIVWNTFSGMFPESRMLKSFGDAVSGMFPVFRRKP